MDEIRAKVKQDYMKGLRYKDICKKYNLNMNTLKSWVKRYNWSDERKKLKKKGAHKNKRGAPKGNKNAVGNTGGAAPPKNKNAETHGFFSKYLPKETLSIMQGIQEKDPLDILWENITIQYAAIVRAQKIMYVEDAYDISNEISMESSGKGGSTTAYAVQYAWDKQATFLKAQSRAMAELRNMIAKYDELLKSSLATEEQKLRIEKLKADIEKAKDPNKDKPIEILIKRKGEE